MEDNHPHRVGDFRGTSETGCTPVQDSDPDFYSSFLTGEGFSFVILPHIMVLSDGHGGVFIEGWISLLFHMVLDLGREARLED
jgi:hypothetical protein